MQRVKGWERQVSLSGIIQKGMSKKSRNDGMPGVVCIWCSMIQTKGDFRG